MKYVVVGGTILNDMLYADGSTASGYMGNVSSCFLSDDLCKSAHPFVQGGYHVVVGSFLSGKYMGGSFRTIKGAFYIASYDEMGIF